MKANGGIFEMTKASPYAGTSFYTASVYFHTAVAILTSLLWVVLIILSLVKFDRDPRPNVFAATHRILGRIGMILMGLTGITGIQIYVMGFIGS